MAEEQSYDDDLTDNEYSKDDRVLLQEDIRQTYGRRWSSNLKWIFKGKFYSYASHDFPHVGSLVYCVIAYVNNS